MFLPWLLEGTLSDGLYQNYLQTIGIIGCVLFVGFNIFGKIERAQNYMKIRFNFFDNQYIVLIPHISLLGIIFLAQAFVEAHTIGIIYKIFLGLSLFSLIKINTTIASTENK